MTHKEIEWYVFWQALALTFMIVVIFMAIVIKIAGWPTINWRPKIVNKTVIQKGIEIDKINKRLEVL